MLARSHRIRRGEDFRRVVRRGRRSATSLAVIYRTPSTVADGPHFGIIVSSQVGNAVHRNRVRRRLRAICASVTLPPDSGEIVIRALPAARDADWDSLRAEIERGLRRVVMA